MLLVDDSRGFIQGLEAYLKHSEEIAIKGIARSGAECLEKIGKLDLDVILMDIRMETAKAGLLTAKKIKEQKLTRSKIIFLTSEYHKSDICKALSMDCSFVDKSCSVPYLITLLKRILFHNRVIIYI